MRLRLNYILGVQRRYPLKGRATGIWEELAEGV